MIWMLVAAAGATGAGILVPLVVQRVVDGPVRHRHPGGLLELGALALLLGLTDDPKALDEHSHRWRPWRSYAVIRLWRS